MNVTVKRQIVLPWRQVLRISFNSVRVRLFRSLITTLTLALAVSFTTYTWGGYEILNGLWPRADKALQESILAAGYELVGGEFGTGPKDRWLAFLSLLVCVVGIVNAQLMSVTERFREIGTFKCLGALNTFVVRIFVLEAIYQGFLGGFAGSVAGMLVISMSLLVKFGWQVLFQYPLPQIIVTCLETTLLAVLLSLLGVIYPALVAARMQPAVALRSEA